MTQNSILVETHCKVLTRTKSVRQIKSKAT